MRKKDNQVAFWEIDSIVVLCYLLYRIYYYAKIEFLCPLMSLNLVVHAQDYLADDNEKDTEQSQL